MRTLRLTQSTAGPDQYRVEIALEGDGLVRQTATANVDFKLTPQEQEDIRWYLEDFLQYPLDPAPAVAERVEACLAEIGTNLFKAVFQANDGARDLWATLRRELDGARVEIVSGVREAASIPWELIHDHRTDIALALRARAFVRAQPEVVLRPERPQTGSGPIRILLVICRPRRDEDVPFRSVASRLIKGLGKQASEVFQLDVLRPPTFEQMARVLRGAKARGEPYHIVHFDGHGAYIDVPEDEPETSRLERILADILGRLSPLVLGARTGSHGYLLFEDPDVSKNVALIDGQKLGQLLFEADAPVLVLNACRSAHAEAPTAPESVEAEEDVPAQVRAFGSLAQEVMDAGVAGVVAMRYNVYVVTAAQFVADLYAALAQGHTLGEAVTLGRKQLAADPQRTIAYDPVPLQDWPVPVVYEAAPITLFPKPAAADEVKITVGAGEATPERGTLLNVPPRPDVGFFGRDETLLALDRAFDTQQIVLLHGYAGSGKTTTAAEFARWYALTGGVDGPVLFTSFERHKPLGRVLDDFGQVFGGWLEETRGVHWPALDDEERRDVALQVMKKSFPVLWVWDNVEPVAGFPEGTESAWSEAEQRELVDFVRAARETRAKFLLTSRRKEERWLGDLPRRIRVPTMPMQERVQLTRALAEKHGRRITDVEDWRPLLRFTRGNPLTITVLVGQALREGMRSRARIETFVERLRAGEARLEDDESQGRSGSLGASLSYGFAHAFSEDAGKQLALLHLFQGFVKVQVLRVMGDPEQEWGLPEMRGFTDEDGIALLDRAAEVGLLTAVGGGYYTIHPALPWYFKDMFDDHYPGEAGTRAARAFVEAMGELGNYYHHEYESGNRDVIAALEAEEANLLHARRLARAHGRWRAVIGAMQGLDQLYGHTGRRAEWARLVREIAPDFVDPATGGPLPGREDAWSLLTGYRVHLAREGRNWAEAERLQRTSVERDRRRAAPALAVPPEALDAGQRNVIRTLAVSLEVLGNILRERGLPACAETYEETIPLCQRIGDSAEEAVIAFNLGHAYGGVSIPALRDLAQAERWYRRSLELCAKGDRLARGKCHNQLGMVAYERFREARDAGRPEDEFLEHLNDAARLYHQALDLSPSNAVDDLAVAHSQLGLIYDDSGDLDRAMRHWRESIHYREAAGNLYGAGQTRFNVALALRDAGRLEDALLYAQAALRNFEHYGDRAADMIQETQGLIAEIEQAKRGG